MAPALAEIEKGSTCEDAEDASAAADIEDDFIPEEVLVLHDGIFVCLRADTVLQHFLVDGEVRITIEVVVRVLDVPDVGLLLSFRFFLHALKIYIVG